ncbi:MAG: hypothetical protein H6863_00775 [Rhodospirillales bacterium]|nr:hypothetical protein [Rhodospirillales bacterium]
MGSPSSDIKFLDFPDTFPDSLKHVANSTLRDFYNFAPEGIDFYRRFISHPSLAFFWHDVDKNVAHAPPQNGSCITIHSIFSCFSFAFIRNKNKPNLSRKEFNEHIKEIQKKIRAIYRLCGASILVEDTINSYLHVVLLETDREYFSGSVPNINFLLQDLNRKIDNARDRGFLDRQ